MTPGFLNGNLCIIVYYDQVVGRDQGKEAGLGEGGEKGCLEGRPCTHNSGERLCLFRG